MQVGVCAYLRTIAFFFLEYSHTKRNSLPPTSTLSFQIYFFLFTDIEEFLFPPESDSSNVGDPLC